MVSTVVISYHFFNNSCIPSLVPDNIVMTILSARLSQLDCVSRGWVLHGYPTTREQAETLSKEGFVPNR